MPITPYSWTVVPLATDVKWGNMVLCIPIFPAFWTMGRPSFCTMEANKGGLLAFHISGFPSLYPSMSQAICSACVPALRHSGFLGIWASCLPAFLPAVFMGLRLSTFMCLLLPILPSFQAS